MTQKLSNISVDPLRADELILCWGDVSFKPNKFYTFFFRNLNPPTQVPAIWKSKCMMKHKVFAWLMFMGRVNTRNLLCRRHLNIGDDHSCLLCSN